MEYASEVSVARDGARFFDEKKRDLGWAAKVSKRNHPTLGGLTVLDIATAEPSLAMFLRSLDKGRLFVRPTDVLGESFAFAWASGYANGQEIRVQGVLEDK
jgi:hypothetical protein